MEASDSFMISAAKSHSSSFNARFSSLDGVTMEYCWGGRLCLSLNNVFAQGEVEEGVYSACCQNGLGTAKGTAIGIITAEKISGAISSLVPNFVDEEAPKKLMPKAIMWAGVRTYLSWERTDGWKRKIILSVKVRAVTFMSKKIINLIAYLPNFVKISFAKTSEAAWEIWPLSTTRSIPFSMTALHTSFSQKI